MLIIIIISLGQILLLYIANTSRTHARKHTRTHARRYAGTHARTNGGRTHTRAPPPPPHTHTSVAVSLCDGSVPASSEKKAERQQRERKDHQDCHLECGQHDRTEDKRSWILCSGGRLTSCASKRQSGRAVRRKRWEMA